MRRHFSSVLIIMLSIACVGNAQQRKQFGKIALTLGWVEVESPGAEAKRVKIGTTLRVNDIVRTKEKSRVEISLRGGGKIRLGEKSEMELTKASVMGMHKDFNANLKKGNVWVSAKAAFGEKKNVAVRTPTAVAAIRGTKYRAEAGEEESSVLVYEGEVEVNRPENLQKMRRDALEKKQQEGGPPKFRLGPVQKIEAPTQVAGPYEVSLEDWIKLVDGMQINLRADGKYHMFEFDKETDAQSDWVKWNKELDTE